MRCGGQCARAERGGGREQGTGLPRGEAAGACRLRELVGEEYRAADVGAVVGVGAVDYWGHVVWRLARSVNRGITGLCDVGEGRYFDADCGDV